MTNPTENLDTTFRLARKLRPAPGRSTSPTSRACPCRTDGPFCDRTRCGRLLDEVEPR